MYYINKNKKVKTKNTPLCELKGKAQKMQDDLISRINERMSGFSKSQKRIADFIITHYEKAAYMTALRLGNNVDVSESTVVRFAIELGYEGYPEMQKALQSYIKNRLTAIQRIEITNDRIGDGNLLKNVLSQDIDRIRSTMELNSEEAFNSSVDAILNAENIYILGAMSSNVLARFLDYYLQLTFSNVHFVRSINTSGIYQQMIRISEKDTFIAISFPRYSKSTLNATQFAKSSGANIVAITDCVASPLAEFADELLLAKSDMASFADSLVAPLSVINALIVAVGMKNKDSLETTFEKLEAMWDANECYKKDN